MGKKYRIEFRLPDIVKDVMISKPEMHFWQTRDEIPSYYQKIDVPRYPDDVFRVESTTIYEQPRSGIFFDEPTFHALVWLKAHSDF